MYAKPLQCAKARLDLGLGMALLGRTLEPGKSLHRVRCPGGAEQQAEAKLVLAVGATGLGRLAKR